MTSPLRSKSSLFSSKAIIALIVVQSALFVSSKWFGVDFGRGWTVLIAVSAMLLFVLGLVMSTAWHWLRGSRPQFGLFWLSLFVVVVAISLGWLMSDVRVARGRAEIRQRIVGAGGAVEVRSVWPTSNWIGDFFADHYRVTVPSPASNCAELVQSLSPVQALSMHGIEMAEEDRRLICTLPGLRRLSVSYPLLSDADLKSIENCKQLEELALTGGDVTDSGLSSIVKLKKLKTLFLCGTSISGGELERLKELPQLTTLAFDGGALTDDGLKCLNGVEIERLVVFGVRFSPKGFSYLTGLPKLKTLTVEWADIDDRHVEAISALHQLEELELRENELTDRSLDYIARLPELKKLILFEDQISPGGIQSFCTSHPECVVEHK